MTSIDNTTFPSWFQNSSTNMSNQSIMSNNGTRTHFISVYSPLSIVLTAIPVILIIVIIVFGNALVVLAVLSQERLKRKTQNWLIVSLAIADLLVGLLIMPFTLTYELLGRWTFGRAFCEIWLASDVLFVTASIMNLCAISIDRYCSLTDPVHYSATICTPKAKIRILMMIACSWLLAFLICLPPLVGWRPVHGSQDVLYQDLDFGAGGCNLSSNLGYVLYSALGSFFIPLSIVVFIYAKIFMLTRRRMSVQRRKAKQRQNLLQFDNAKSQNGHTSSSRFMTANGIPSNDAFVTRPNNNTTAMEETCETSFDNPAMIRKTSIPNGSAASANENVGTVCAPNLLLKPLELQLRMMQQRKGVRRKERQATLVLGLILGAFILSWMPFFVSYVLSAVCCETPELIFDIIFWLGYCNSGLNPIIYNYFNPDFRWAFRRILCRSR